MANASSGKAGARKNDNSTILLHRYEQLLKIRRCEERLMKLFADGEVPGFIHLSIGQEAVSVGVLDTLSPEDTIASTHRGHGHAIAKGIPLEGFFAELLAKENGVCRGRGGSMHIADMKVGMLGANGIVGAGIPIALGSALAHRVRGTGQVAVSFFGDGAMAEGVLHESLNIASLSKLPILFVCEANGWSEFSPVNSQIGFDVESWASAYGITYTKVDGNDVDAVADAASALIAKIRAGEGPALIECVTKRIRGHYEGDAQKYRPADEAEVSDPLGIARDRLADQGVAEDHLQEIASKVDREIDEAVAAARSGVAASFEAAMADVFSRELG